LPAPTVSAPQRQHGCRFAPVRTVEKHPLRRGADVGCGGWGDPRAGEQSRRQRA